MNNNIKVKIIGAGSIGNHLSNAFRSRKCDVTLCDISSEALDRTRDEIYPSRYGSWDKNIKLSLLHQTIKEEFDVVVIGTPPESHISLALSEIVNTKPKVLLIEKPLTVDSNKDLIKLQKLALKSKVEVLVGYNHRLVKVVKLAEEVLTENDLGRVKTIRSMTREHWKGIFLAHPWIDGPKNSYLGNIQSGGGALLEHSHALNLFLYFMNFLNLGEVKEVSACQSLVKDDTLFYDEITQISIRTSQDLLGLVEQDVVTYPPIKQLRIEGTKGFVELSINSDHDLIRYMIDNKEMKIKKIPKVRKHDFIPEIDHVISQVHGSNKTSPISLSNAFETHKVLMAAFKSSKIGKVVVL